MDLLEHPLEAVAELYSLPDATAATGAAAWTCLAAVLAAAAAAGLWRLRTSTPPAVVPTTGAAMTPELEPPPADAEVLPPPEPSGSSARSPSPSPSPKERYTAYYDGDTARVGCCGVEDEEAGEGDKDEEGPEGDDDGGAHRASLETTMPTDPFGWAEVVRTLPPSPTAAAAGQAQAGRYRSPRAASGSVVRLWDQGAGAALTTSVSPRLRGRVVVVDDTVSAF